MKEQILTLWAQHKTADEICDILGCNRRLVFQHLANARQRGDTRADRRTYRAPAKLRLTKITLLASINASTDFIANTVGISRRMVQIRLKGIGIAPRKEKRLRIFDSPSRHYLLDTRLDELSEGELM